MLLVPIHLRTNLTTRALAALLDISQPAIDRIHDHLVPSPADTPRPDLGRHSGPWIIHATPIAVCMTSRSPAPSTNHPRSINTQINIYAHHRRVVVVDRCRCRAGVAQG
jgi:hypothetical protein